MNIKKIEAQNQILKNFIKAKGLDKDLKENTDKVIHKNIDKYISKDLKLTAIYIFVSFVLLILIKYLNFNFFLNKFL